MEEQTKTMKAVYTIVDRGGKTYWVRIGVGYTNRDGSLNLKLDAIPVNATLHVRDWEPSDRRAEVSDAHPRERGAKPREAARESEPSSHESRL
jgi:hypothetical protein